MVLWNDPGGYDAYRTGPRFRDPKPDEKEAARYGVRRNLPPEVEQRVKKQGWSLSDLQEVVHLFVMHYDVAGVSRRCFKILQDERKLSVHFMLDVDGTIYQTLDLKERAWHATVANDHSIGIEIAHPGAYPQPGHPAMRRWYAKDWRGRHMKYPGFVGDPGVRTKDFVARPARPDLYDGIINGRKVYQYDFTKEQYAALAHLTAALARVFPKIDLKYPMRPDGSPILGQLPKEAAAPAPRPRRPLSRPEEQGRPGTRVRLATHCRAGSGTQSLTAKAVSPYHCGVAPTPHPKLVHHATHQSHHRLRSARSRRSDHFDRRRIRPDDSRFR